ncbi:MAG: hypothetical protein WBD22_03595 [Pyrinomonadaceae bacterium]
MNKGLFRISMSAILLVGFAISAIAQDKIITKKEVTVHPDGSYTVIEYPIGKEVTVNLLPSPTITGGKGIARVIRADGSTKVFVDVSGVPATTNSFYAYAVDAGGVTTLLGPVVVKNGVGTAEFATPMNQFMVVLSPMDGLTAVDQTTTVFHSEVPTGFQVVPKRISENRVVPVTDPAAGYDVPLLNVPKFGEAEKEVKIKFTGDLSGLEGKAYIDREDGTTKIKMHFDDMKKVPANKRLTLWTYSPDGAYTKLGHVINSGKRDESQIVSETSLTDFGLLITVEDSDVMVPTSRTYSVFSIS